MRRISKQEAVVLMNDGICQVVAEGDTFEVRVPNATRAGTAAGYFTDPAKAAASLADLNGVAAGLYVTLNPVDPAILARGNNRLVAGVRAGTTDAEIMSRRWFPIDFDPVRPTGVSATDEEHEQALALADEVRGQLRLHGWPEPLFADSGNGAHLLYRVDMPNDMASTVTMRNALAALDGLFSTDRVKIDTKNHNASRIWKIYGSMAAKGDSTSDRPHRVATVIDRAGDVLETSVLEELAAMSATFVGSATGGVRLAEQGIDDVTKWIEKVGLTLVAGPLPWQDGQKWLLEECPFNPAHRKPMVGLIDGRLVYRCLHHSCEEHGFRALREKVEPGYSAPETLRAKIKNPDDLKATPTILAAADMKSSAFDALVADLRNDRVAGVKAFKEAVVAIKKARSAERDIAEGALPTKRNALALDEYLTRAASEGTVPTYRTDPSSGHMYKGNATNPTWVTCSTGEAWDLMCFCHGQGMLWVGHGDCLRWIETAAVRNQASILEAHLRSLEWDGTPRIADMLVKYFGAEDSDYSREVSRNFMVAMASRGLRPGCQMDYMLVLEGAQGIGKSQAARALGGPFYGNFYGRADSMSDRVRFVQAIAGKLVVEWSELNTLKSSNMDKVKAMISEPSDTVRGAYQRDTKEFLRSCVFIGTTNNTGRYINDGTGARRFWAVPCGLRIDVPGLLHDRNQLLAEAVDLAKTHAPYWKFSGPVQEVLEAEQDARQEMATESTAGSSLYDRLIDPESFLSGHVRRLPTLGGYALTLKPAQLTTVWSSVDAFDPRADLVTKGIMSMLKEVGFRTRVVKERGGPEKRWMIHDDGGPMTVPARQRLQATLRALAEAEQEATKMRSHGSHLRPVKTETPEI